MSESFDLVPRTVTVWLLTARVIAMGVTVAMTGIPSPLPAQAPVRLIDLLLTARQRSPELRAAQEAVSVATGLERQAGAFSNPTLAYGREQTSRGGQSNAQNIVQFEQPLELGSLRGARRDAARARREAAEARVQQERIRLDAEVARAYAIAVGASHRARLAEQFATVVAEAQRVSDQRLAAGDVSGYAARRLRLEAGRFAAARATAQLDQRAARAALVSLLGREPATADSLRLSDDLAEVSSLLAPVMPADAVPVDSLLRAAATARPEVRIARLETTASLAEARVAARSRVPVPVLSAGHKDERVADAQGSTGGFRGIVAGISIPLAVFDRREGAIAAADATARVNTATEGAVLRRVQLDVVNAMDALRSAEVQRRALEPYLGDDARLALTAVQASYTEGELSLVEWLDAMRAYQDAQSTYATLRTELAVRRVALAQALGLPLLPDSLVRGAAAAAPSRNN